jgi:hypothetical protein
MNDKCPGAEIHSDILYQVKIWTIEGSEPLNIDKVPGWVAIEWQSMVGNDSGRLHWGRYTIAAKHITLMRVTKAEEAHD